MRKIAFLLLVILCSSSNSIIAQSPSEFNYQAIIRDSDGKLIENQNVDVQISIIEGSAGATATYRENHSVSTNSYGLISLVIGKGSGDIGTFNSVDWSAGLKFIKLEIDLDGSGYDAVGTFQLSSVPFALHANSASNLIGEVFYSTNTDTLFVVKDHSGNVVFAVFPDGAQVIVNETSKGKVGGFAVSGRSPTKAVDREYLRVTTDSTRIYIDDPIVKGKVGGFAVSGRSPTKEIIEPFFFATIDSTRIFTKDTDGGFGVRDKSTGSVQSYLQLTPQNYFIGHNSGINTTGSQNLFLGYESGRWNTSGISNVFIGPNSGNKNSTGSGNIFIGNAAGYSNTHIDSSAGIGTEGFFNVYIGYNSGEENTRGKYNTYVGYATCASGKTGEFNTYIGNQAGNQSGGNNNVFLGVKAGELCRTGNNNTFLGYFSGQRCYSGSGNVFVGYAAGYGADVSDKLYIDNSSTSSPLIYGDFTNGVERVQVNGDFHATGDITSGGTTSKISDFVFEKNYELESIEEHAAFMWKEKHLPAVKSAKELKKEGKINLNERREQLLEELEKAHIYIEQLNNKVKLIKEENSSLKLKLEEIIKRLNELEKNKY